VEVSARVPGATALLVVHADGDRAVVVDGQRGVRGRMREAAFGHAALARATLVLPTDLRGVCSSERQREREREGEREEAREPANQPTS